MQLQALLATAGLASSAAAFQVSTSNTFKLVANVTAGDLTPSPRSTELIPFTIGDSSCNGVAGLANSGSGSYWYANGTSVFFSPGTVDSDLVWHSAGIHVTLGGTATVPLARPVGIECDNGTEGVGIVQNAAGVPALRYGGETSGWMACRPDGPLTMPEGVNVVEGGFVIGYRAEGQRRFSCAEVVLMAVCVEGEGGDGAVEVPCVIPE